MKVQYSKDTKSDFKKHREYLTRQGKSDGHKYQKYELDGIGKALKNNITNGLETKKEHSDSIFPKKYEYNSDSHKMHIDKKSHYVIFYTIEKKKNGESFIKVQKCIHSTELKKELDDKGIEPLKKCDKTLLKDLETVYKEDEIADKDDSDERYEEDTDDHGNPRRHKTGPEGGRYYSVKINGKWGPWNSTTNENASSKKLSTFISESLDSSDMISLSDYVKIKLLG